MVVSTEDKYIIATKSDTFQVQITKDRKCFYVGCYKTIEEARQARDVAVTSMRKAGFTLDTNRRNYVDSKSMYYEMIVSKAQGKMTDELLKMCMKIVKEVGKKFRYNDEEDRFDCQAYSYEVIIKNWHQFDEEKYSLPFNYITEIVKRAYAMQFKILQKNRVNTISLNQFGADGEFTINI